MCGVLGVKWNKWALTGIGVRYLKFVVTAWTDTMSRADKSFVLDEAEEVSTRVSDSRLVNRDRVFPRPSVLDSADSCHRRVFCCRRVIRVH